jgi:hypothetical protein
MNNPYHFHGTPPLVKKATIGVFLAVPLLLAACSHIPTQFGGSWPLPAEHKSSTAIDLGRPVIEPVEGGVRVTGYLHKQVAAATTANSHVDVQFVDTSGAVLLEKPTAFVPGDLRGGSMRSRPSARYEVIVAPMPAGTARVRVVAHDQQHEKL